MARDVPCGGGAVLPDARACACCARAYVWPCDAPHFADCVTAGLCYSRDDSCDASAGLTGAIELERVFRVPTSCDSDSSTSGDSSTPSRLVGIVGAGCSGSTLPAALYAAVYGIPMISPTSTSPELSQASVHPYFLRTPLSDEDGSEAMVWVLKQLFNYEYVTLVSSTDA